MKKKLIVMILMVFIAIIALSSGCVSAESPTNEIVMENHVVVTIADDEANYDLSWPNGGSQSFAILRQETGLPLLLYNNVQREINFISIRNNL